jgi:hypothetical protein
MMILESLNGLVLLQHLALAFETTLFFMAFISKAIEVGDQVSILSCTVLGT